MSVNTYSHIISSGGLLPADLLSKVASNDSQIEGLGPTDYHLGSGERLSEATSRSWNRLTGVWLSFKAAMEKAPVSDLGTGLTREKWLGAVFQELGFGRLAPSQAKKLSNKEFPISHFWAQTPIHQVGFRLKLDTRTPGAVGAAKQSPFSLVRQFLNASDDHFWGIVTNGLVLRLLRDDKSLTRQSFLEFDLEGIFETNSFPEFALFWLFCHQSRFEGERPSECWLEKWSQLARETGVRALDALRIGVQRAIEALGQGFLKAPNNELKEKLHSGQLSKEDFYRQLLRLVYRLIFLFVTEDRGALHSPESSEDSKIIYRDYYSTQNLRRLAQKFRGSQHSDLIPVIWLVMKKLGESKGCPELGLPCLGSFLWSHEALNDLEGCLISNRDLLEAIRKSAFTETEGARTLRNIDFANLGTEELGSVYEALLELWPNLDLNSMNFSLQIKPGNERKTSGSYYTPDSLVQCLLDSALEPVIANAIRGKTDIEAEKEILSLKVCDPAVGSGHFLIGAAHRLAKHLVEFRAYGQGDGDESSTLYQHAVRDVIGHCLYGVDINPMSAELCRISLWLEAMEPGKPLSFLEHQIRVGNSLLGTSLDLIKKGLPDEAFNPIEGDESKFCSALKKRNKQEREGHQDMFYLMAAEPKKEYNSIEEQTLALIEVSDETVENVRKKEDGFKKLVVSPAYQHSKVIADAWCAAFVWHKRANVLAEPLTTDAIRRLESDPNALTSSQKIEVERLANQYNFFQWHLVFPEVFSKGGFDCVLGNPPWEKIQSEEQSYFSSHSQEIATAVGAERKRLIEKLKETNPNLHREWLEYRRGIEAIDSFLKGSGRYPLTGKGKLNTYAVFAEHAKNLIDSQGAFGQILPLGIVTDDNTKEFFWNLISKERLRILYGLENEDLIFPEVHHSFKFCLFVATGSAVTAGTADFVFFCRTIEDIKKMENHFLMKASDIELINPNTKNCPTFRNVRDFEVVSSIYRRNPIMVLDNGQSPWPVELHRVINPTDDSDLMYKHNSGNPRTEVVDKDGSVFVRVYEGKMIHQYDHRFGSYLGQTQAQSNQGKLPELTATQHNDPFFLSQPQYWVESKIIEPWLARYSSRQWLFAFRDITSSVVLRTCITAIIPRVGPVDPCRCIFFPEKVPALMACSFVAALNSFVFDYVARQSVSGMHLAIFVMKQLPVPSPKQLSTPIWPEVDLKEWIYKRVLELTYTAWDLEKFAHDCGWAGSPFKWDEERRFLIRCELDALFFHIYLPSNENGKWRPAESDTVENLKRLNLSFPTPRAAVAYILDTFPIVRSNDEEKFGGDFKTKRVILEFYDGMQESVTTGKPYKTRLDPPPGDPRCCHPAVDVKRGKNKKEN